MTPQKGVRKEVKTPDGRRLAVDITGAPDGTAVFLMHGTPGSRSGPKPRGIVLYRLGVRLICYDRPGYGESDRHPGRSVADAAADTAVIADELGIDRFAVVGRSGGGPHALACAALLPNRVTRAAVLVSVAPYDAPKLDWYAGMNQSNVDDYTTADSDADALAASLATRADDIRRNPIRLVEFLRPYLSAADKRVVEDVAIRRLLLDTYAEALKHGPYGWIDDALAFRRPWNFDLGSVSVPVLLWHGKEDNFSPPTHSEWLGTQIPHARVHVQEGAAHFGAVEILPEMLTWVTTADLVTLPPY